MNPQMREDDADDADEAVVAKPKAAKTPAAKAEPTPVVEETPAEQAEQENTADKS